MVKKKKTFSRDPRGKQEKTLVLKKNYTTNGGELTGIAESLKITEPTHRFEASLSTLEELTDSVMKVIKKEQQNPGKHWKTTLKDYLVATDSKLIHILKILLAILTLGLSILFSLLLLNWLLASATVSSGLFLFPRSAGNAHKENAPGSGNRGRKHERQPLLG